MLLKLKNVDSFTPSVGVAKIIQGTYYITCIQPSTGTKLCILCKYSNKSIFIQHIFLLFQFFLMTLFLFPVPLKLFLQFFYSFIMTLYFFFMVLFCLLQMLLEFIKLLFLLWTMKQ